MEITFSTQSRGEKYNWIRAGISANELCVGPICYEVKNVFETLQLNASL